LIWFFALVAAGIAVRVAFTGNTVLMVIFATIAVGLVGLSVWLRQQPPVQMHIDGQQIVLASPKRQLGRLSREETAGSVVVASVIHKGHLQAYLSKPGPEPWSGLSLDGFDGIQVAEACTAHGWTVEHART
jgi:hypothetical protein